MFSVLVAAAPMLVHTLQPPPSHACPNTCSAPQRVPWPPCSGLHFLAVMPDEEAELCSGLWMLLDRKPPSF